MKKDRNAFFQNQSASSYFYPTNMMPNAGMYPNMTESNSSFYSGPVMMPGQDNYSSEIESRLAKIERSIARLDTRLTKLESEIISSSGSDNISANNMYVI